MGISVNEIKELREMTSCGVIECKKALEEASGDFNKAKEILQKRGLELAVKKVIHHQPVRNKDALRNPEVLDYYANIKELEED